ncbi:cytochrome P450 [Phanerochaete sordida]|uniref:Cytochrome P450 n=1 Tax=Phanerochaete sordida TaxID=48140 RepID=A0A9P3FZC7_9APHY|nr:cytochrome P450 [Phanerochaete sordida]
MIPLTVLAFVAAVGLGLWKIFQGYITRSPLDNIPGPERTSFWQGNYGDIYHRHAWNFHDRARELFGPVFRFWGPLGTRGLYVFDPKALNNIIVKDQHVYEETRWFISWNINAFGLGLLSTLGEHHRKQRKLLNPVFSIAHMRHMTPIFYHTTHRLRAAVASEVGRDSAEVDVLGWMGRLALELIGQGGLGYSFDPLVSSARNSYGDAIKDYAPLLISMQLWRTFYPYVYDYVPLSVRRFFAPLVPARNYQRIREIINTMDYHSRRIFREKKAALEKGDEAVLMQVGAGKDIMSILLKANMEAADEDKLDEDELIGQMSTLVFAATDTTSNALSRIFHLLADHQDVQDKMRAELMEAGPDGEDIPYDTLVALPYMDAVCRETLRLHPPVNSMARETREDVVMPLSEPIVGRNGEAMSEILVPKDTLILVGIRACNRNKALWGDDAEEWKPERWLAPLPEALGGAHVPGVYSHLMTFLGGGRACIGFKFSQLEMKVVLAVMLRSFKFLPGKREIYWNMGGINYPTAGKESDKVCMYLRLEPVGPQ